MSPGPLSGVRVVEFANLVAGPYAGMLLADMGADVIKVETPAGDLARGFGPYLRGESAFFLAVNRGKRSVAVDPKNLDARRWMDRLVGGADVVLHNLRRGAMERMGYGEERVREMNPTVVYAVVSAFGADGPYADRAGIGIIVPAESGMVSITGHPGDPPQKTATTIGDYVAGTNAAFAVCAALFERERGGRGRRIDVSLRDGLLAVQSGWWALYFAQERQPERTGTASPFLAPNQIFPTADGHMALAIVSDRHFAILCEELGRLDLAERFASNDARMEGRPDLVEALTAIFVTDTTEAWVSRLDAAGLPVGRVLEFSGVEADPQIAHNQMVAEWDHPTVGKIKGVGSPMRVDGDPTRAGSAPPTLGQHTREVLEELGAAPSEVDRLVAAGAVVLS